MEEASQAERNTLYVTLLNCRRSVERNSHIGENPIVTSDRRGHPSSCDRSPLNSAISASRCE